MATIKVSKKHPLLKQYKNITPVGAAIMGSRNGDVIRIPQGRWSTDPQTVIDKNLILKGMGPNKTELFVNRFATWLTFSKFGNIVLENMTIIISPQSNAIVLDASSFGAFKLNNVIIRYAEEDRLTIYETYPGIVSELPETTETRQIVLNRTYIQYLEICTHLLTIKNSILGDIKKPQSSIHVNGDGELVTIKNTSITRTLFINEDKKQIELQNIDTNGEITTQGNTQFKNLNVLSVGQIALPKSAMTRTPWLQQLKEKIKTSPIFAVLYKNSALTLSDTLKQLNFTPYGFVLRTQDLDGYRSIVTVTGPVKSKLDQRSQTNYFGLGFINAINTDLVLTDTNIPMFDLSSVAKNGTITLNDASVTSHWDIDNMTVSTKQGDGLTLDPELVQDYAKAKPALEQLDELTGLSEAKKLVKQIVSVASMNAERKKRGLPQTKDLSLHMVFLGNAGVGKTTVARLLARALFENKVLPSNKLIEVTSKDLIAGYVGQTRSKTHEVIESALGGVLFIDEAYSLRGNNNQADFASEAVDQLIADMENNRDQLIVVLAGYTDEMLDFLRNGNPGLRSRFANHIMFEDYTFDELCDIMKYQMVQSNVNPRNKEASKALHAGLHKLFDAISDEGGRNSGNGRFVRNYIQAVAMARDVRLSSGDLNDASNELLSQFTSDDVKQAYRKLRINLETMK